MPLRLVVLISGSGTLLQALLDAAAAGKLDGEVVAVGSDRADAYGLVRAEQAGVPTFVHPLAKGGDRAAWDAELTEKIAAFEPDLVVSAGFMKLVGAAFLARFGGRMINTHPALLPSFPGMHGVRDALAHGVKVTGATVFVVDTGVDTGEILAQAAVPVHRDDTEDVLHERIKVVERQLLLDAINNFNTRG
jgi:phosphoribosylglycinamide formyltransferase 1